MFGPIFEPFLEILKPIYEGVYAVIDAFSSLMEPFNALLNIFSSVHFLKLFKANVRSSGIFLFFCICRLVQ